MHFKVDLAFKKQGSLFQSWLVPTVVSEALFSKTNESYQLEFIFYRRDLGAVEILLIY